MKHGRAILAAGLAVAVLGGCDPGRMSPSAGSVPRAEYDRALADAKRQREEADSQRAQAQQCKAQAEQDRKLLEQIRAETGRVFDTLKEEERAKSARVPSLQQANDDLVTRIHDLGKRVRDLENDLSQSVKAYKALEQENRALRAKSPEPVPTPVVAPAGGTKVAGPPAVLPPVPGPRPVTEAEKERLRLLAEAAKMLGEAKAVLGEGGGPAAPGAAAVSAATRPASKPAPPAAGLTGAVVEAAGARVRINLGGRNGLSKDTRMYIHRGSQFIGVLQLTAVEEASAEGIVDGRLAAAVGDQAVVFGN